jgi:ankyrin repeat protein
MKLMAISRPFLLIIIFILLTVTFCTRTPIRNEDAFKPIASIQKGGFYQAEVKSGAIMKNEPSPLGETVVEIPMRSIVTVVYDKNPHYLKVHFNDQVGYLNVLYLKEVPFEIAKIINGPRESRRLKALAEHKADSLKRAFFPAVESGRLGDIISCLNSGMDVNSTNKNGECALEIATGNADIVVFDSLLLRGALPKNESAHYLLSERSFLIPMLNMNQLASISEALSERGGEVLLESFFDIAPTIDGGVYGFGEALINAIYFGRIEIAKILIDNKTNVNHLTMKAQRTPLLYAVQVRNIEILKYLLEAGADPNVQDKSGWAPIHLASQFGFIEHVKILVESGANPSLKNYDGATSTDIAKENGDIALVRYLETI